MLSRRSRLLAIAIFHPWVYANPIDWLKSQAGPMMDPRGSAPLERREWPAGVDIDLLVDDHSWDFVSTSGAIVTDRFDLSNVDLICGQNLEDADPDLANEIWWKIGGSEIMEALFDEWETSADWMNNFQTLVLGNGADGIACGDLRLGSCASFEVKCDEFFPQIPSLWWIRYAVFNAFSILQGLYNGLRDNVVSDLLNLPELANDFDIPDEFRGENVPTSVTGALTVAAGATSAFWPLSGTISIVNGLISIFGQSDPPPNPEGLMQAQLSSTFDTISTQLQDFAAALLDGNNPSYLPYPQPCSYPELSNLSMICTQGTPGEVSPISNFFANGKFLYDTVDDDIDPIIEDLHIRIKQQLAVTAMRASGYWIWLNPHVSDSHTCVTQWPGAQWNNGCFMLYYPNADNDEPMPVETDLIDRLQNYYKINMYDFYHNADRCQVHHPNYDGYMDHSTLNWYLGQYPPCFFNVYVLYADEYVMCGSGGSSQGHDYPDAINVDGFCWNRYRPELPHPGPKLA